LRSNFAVCRTNFAHKLFFYISKFSFRNISDIFSVSTHRLILSLYYGNSKRPKNRNDNIRDVCKFVFNFINL
jgi:hypothetical protein